MAVIHYIFLLFILNNLYGYGVTRNTLVFPESVLDSSQVEKESAPLPPEDPTIVPEQLGDKILSEVAKLEGSVRAALFEANYGPDFFDIKFPGAFNWKLTLNEGPKQVAKVDSEQINQQPEPRLEEQIMESETKEALEEYDAVVDQVDDFGKIMPALLMDSTGHEPKFIINGQEPKPAMPPTIDLPKLNLTLPKLNITKPPLPIILNVSSLTNLQNFPGIPGAPKLPNLPNLPSMQNLPNIPIPPVPTIPGLPPLPSIPTIPDFPTIPGIPNMQIMDHEEEAEEHNGTATNQTHHGGHHKKKGLRGSDGMSVKISGSDKVNINLAMLFMLLILVVSLKNIN